jgi:hypothetical protein
MVGDKEGDASNERYEEGEHASKSKYRKGAACGDGIDPNSIYNGWACDEIVRKE